MAARAHVPSTTGVPWAPPAARGLELSAAPNPLRSGAARVRLAAPSGARVTLDLLDLSGRRLARLFEGALAAPREMVWDGRDGRGRRLPAGVYWLRLGSGVRASVSRKVVIAP
jgi:hypothetical protein